MIKIAIDGPSGAGKHACQSPAARLGIIYVDTGALYRAVGYYVKAKELTLRIQLRWRRFARNKYRA